MKNPLEYQAIRNIFSYMLPMKKQETKETLKLIDLFSPQDF